MKAEMYSVNFWVSDTDPQRLKLSINRGLTTSGFEVLKFVEHHFKPFGFTGLWLLSESHLAVHTFPEEKRTYIEISSCVPDPYFKFLNYVNSTFRTKKL